MSAAAPALDPAWALFLDVDGTLIDLTVSPDHAQVSVELRRLLLRLHQTAGGAVALISGRPIAVIDRLFPEFQFPVAGLHGIERRDARGALALHAPPVARLWACRAALEEAVVQHPALLLEDKGASLAIHYRRAPELRDLVQGLLEVAQAAAGPAYCLQDGKYFLELKPAGRDKGIAVREFMAEEPFRGRIPVFVGDDVTDEYGFATVNQLGGHSIKVGAGPTVAQWRLPDVSAVRLWMERGCVSTTPQTSRDSHPA